MKKIILILLISFAFSGCPSGGEQTSQAEKTNRSYSQNSSDSAPASADQPANNMSQMPQSAERVEQIFEVNFRDGLPRGWAAVDPEKTDPSVFEMKDGVLRLRIQTDRDLYGENQTAPRLLKTVAGDFEIETRVKFSPIEDYQGAGLLIYRNANNYLRLERAFGGVGGGESGIRFDRREEEIYEPIAAPDKFPTAAREVELKIRRHGKEFSGFWRAAGKTEWTEVGKIATGYPETVQIGVIGVNTAREITAEFAYVRIAPAAK